MGESRCLAMCESAFAEGWRRPGASTCGCRMGASGPLWRCCMSCVTESADVQEVLFMWVDSNSSDRAIIMADEQMNALLARISDRNLERMRASFAEAGDEELVQILSARLGLPFQVEAVSASPTS